MKGTPVIETDTWQGNGAENGFKRAPDALGQPEQPVSWYPTGICAAAALSAVRAAAPDAVSLRSAQHRRRINGLRHQFGDSPWSLTSSCRATLCDVEAHLKFSVGHGVKYCSVRLI